MRVVRLCGLRLCGLRLRRLPRYVLHPLCRHRLPASMCWCPTHGAEEDGPTPCRKLKPRLSSSRQTPDTNPDAYRSRTRNHGLHPCGHREGRQRFAIVPGGATSPCRPRRDLQRPPARRRHRGSPHSVAQDPGMCAHGGNRSPPFPAAAKNAGVENAKKNPGLARSDVSCAAIRTSAARAARPDRRCRSRRIQGGRGRQSWCQAAGHAGTPPIPWWSTRVGHAVFRPRQGRFRPAMGSGRTAASSHRHARSAPRIRLPGRPCRAQSRQRWIRCVMHPAGPRWTVSFATGGTARRPRRGAHPAWVECRCPDRRWFAEPSPQAQERRIPSTRRIGGCVIPWTPTLPAGRARP